MEDLTYNGLSSLEKQLMETLEASLLSNSQNQAFETLFFDLCHQTKGMPFANTPSLLHRKLLPALCRLDRKLRVQERIDLVQTLAQSGKSITVIGRGWDKIELPSNVHVQGSCSFEGQLRFFSQSKVVMHCSPYTFQSPTHDRLLNATLHGALVISNCPQTSCNLKPNEHYLGYERFNPSLALEKLLWAFQYPQAAQQIVDTGRHQVQQHHLWSHRAQQLLKTLK